VCLAASLGAADPSYFRDVRPVLQRQCQGCHQPNLKSSNLDLTTYEGLAAGGKHGPGLNFIVKYLTGEMKPQMPLEGQLVSLQHRLMRAARAILDPSLQLGWVNRDAAYRMLQHDVVLSPAMAQQEVERYTFRAPGQATSYFCGYTRLMEMRTDAERLLGDQFDRQAYHDFILSQGLLPPALLRKAGFASTRSLQVDEARWRPWQAAPPAGFPRAGS